MQHAIWFKQYLLLAILFRRFSDRFMCIPGLYCAWVADVKLYLVGGEIGLGKGTWNTDIYEINTLSRRVTRKLKMPEKRRSHLCCCSSASLYIFGGVDRYRVRRNELFRVDLTTGTLSATQSRVS